MYKSKTMTLIDGDFSSDEAFELLRNLYSSKIQFHELKNYSSKERVGKEDEIAMKRISELKESLESILIVIKEASKGENRIEIKSVIDISFVK